MRILYINSVYRRGSTGKIVHELYTAANAAGHTAAVCYGRGAEVEGENVFKFGLDWETVAHAALTRVTGLTGCYSYFSTRRLLRFIDEFKPDIIHLHEPHAYFVNIKPLFNYVKAHKIPLVYTFHCEFAFTGKCGKTSGCERWKTGCGNCAGIKEYPKTMFFDFTAKMWRDKREMMAGQDMVICTPSKWLANMVAESFLGGYTVRVVPNGIDTELFRPVDYQEIKTRHGLTDEKIVLSVAPGMLSNPHKGGAEVLKLAESMRNENVHFFLIGADKPEENVPENVTVIQHTENQKELAAYYSMADVFVICSDMETYPTTCLEALCCGTPVAGYDAGGAAETAPDGLGLFCRYGDTATLRENVTALLNNPPEAAAFESVRERCASAWMYAEYEKIYHDILNKD
ncbi:MAG: glycosyltransferase [Oscillospiraceae bacterium]|nr:glycosyltransferase [Oscillospiraceae bacterium]